MIITLKSGDPGTAFRAGEAGMAQMVAVVASGIFDTSDRSRGGQGSTDEIIIQ